VGVSASLPGQGWRVLRTNSGASIVERCERKRARQGAGILLLVGSMARRMWRRRVVDEETMVIIITSYIAILSNTSRNAVLGEELASK
jgi:hypothetical protein